MSETTQWLSELGVRIAQGHSPNHLEGTDLVVISSAIGHSNPEVVEARARGLTVVRRAEMLAELMRLKYGIAVAGTHGKTTTTSLVGSLMTEVGMDPTVIVGGRMRVSGTGARVGKSDYLVAEADEFDRSFLRLAPIIAVVTCIDRDHLDTYRDLQEIQDAFVEFADKVPFFGQVILCVDDEGVQQVLPRLAERRLLTYGLSPQAELSAVDVEPRGWGSRFRVVQAGVGDLGAVELPMPGDHNVRNALAAIAVGLSLDLDFSAISAALASFGGVHRRFEHLGDWRGAALVDDYAHHPTEVAAALKAARQACTGRVHAVFQPHLYSRTEQLAEDFGRSLMAADHALVTEIYGSREGPHRRSVRGDGGHRGSVQRASQRLLLRRLAGSPGSPSRGGVPRGSGHHPGGRQYQPFGTLPTRPRGCEGGRGMSTASAPREASSAVASPHRPRPMLAPEPPQSPFRRPGVVQRHRRKRRLLGALKLFAAALLLVGAPVGVAVWALTTPHLALEHLEVRSANRVPVSWVEEALSPLVGQNLLRLSLPSASLRLREHPWVAGASLRKSLPHGLKVDILPRRPRAVLEGSGERSFVDGRGEVIARLESGEGSLGLPLLRGALPAPEDVRRALAIAAEPGRVKLLWADSLTEVEALGPRDFRLSFEDLPFPLLVRSGSLEEKERHLERVLPEIAARYRYVRALDLRFARRIVLQPESERGNRAPDRLPSRG